MVIWLESSIFEGGIVYNYQDPMAGEGFDGNLLRSSHDIWMILFYSTKWTLDKDVCCSLRVVAK